VTVELLRGDVLDVLPRLAQEIRAGER